MDNSNKDIQIPHQMQQKKLEAPYLMLVSYWQWLLHSLRLFKSGFFLLTSIYIYIYNYDSIVFLLLASVISCIRARSLSLCSTFTVIDDEKLGELFDWLFCELKVKCRGKFYLDCWNGWISVVVIIDKSGVKHIQLLYILFILTIVSQIILKKER